MRLAAVLSVCLIVCTPAAAEAPAPSETEQQAAAAIADSMIELALSSSMLETELNAGASELRQHILGGSFYQHLRPETQRSLLVFVDALPALVREEVTRQLAYTEGDFAERLLNRFTAEELSALASLMNDPIFKDAVTQMSRDSSYELPPPERAQLESELERRFGPPAEMGMPHMWDVVRVLAESAAAARRDSMPQFQQRFLSGVCAALGDECPSHIRGFVSRGADDD